MVSAATNMAAIAPNIASRQRPRRPARRCRARRSRPSTTTARRRQQPRAARSTPVESSAIERGDLGQRENEDQVEEQLERGHRRRSVGGLHPHPPYSSHASDACHPAWSGGQPYPRRQRSGVARPVRGRSVGPASSRGRTSGASAGEVDPSERGGTGGPTPCRDVRTWTQKSMSPPPGIAGRRLVLLRLVRDHGLGGEEQRRDRRGVLQRRAGDLGRVDDARP